MKAVVYHDKIYVIGGFDGQNRLKSVEIYDPSVSASWQTAPVELNKKRSNFGVSVVDHRIMVVGGYDGNGVTSHAEVFDDKTGVWIVQEQMRKARSALTVAVLDDFNLNYYDYVR